MKAFLFGLGLGITMGVLFAPAGGRETRDNVAGRATDLAGSAKDKLTNMRDSVRSRVDAVRDAVGGRVRPTGTETVAP